MKEGDYVLVDHPMLYDDYVVRRVVSVKNKMVELVRLSDDYDTELRKKTAVRGIFAGEDEARAAINIISNARDQMRDEEKAAKAVFHKRVQALTVCKP